MVRILGSTGSRRRRRYQLAAIASMLTVLAAFAAMPAQASPYLGGVQDTGLFALDGNTLPITCGPPDDWAALYTVGGNAPCSSTGFVFIADGTGSADHTYWSQGGSKDAYDPALGPWLWKPNDVSPDKNDIVNAFAAAYTKPASGGIDETKFLFFGSDRFNTNGDSQQGFQFLQSDVCLAGPVNGVGAGGTAECPGSTPNQTTNAGKFVDPTTGNPIHHKNGDLLILVNFNNGGTLGLAGVFEWSGADGLGGGSYSQVLFGNGANCATITDPNKFCSIANTGPLSGEPVWPYTAKGVTGPATYATSAFIEGGANLSAIPGAGSCFPTFLAETRSSAGPSSGLSLQAQLKDLAIGKFQLCGSKTETTPSSTSDGNTPIPADGVSVGTGNTGVDVYDKAVVTVTGVNTFDGNVTFHLCGPTPLSDANYTLCASGGASIGSAKSVNNPSPATVVSDAAHLTKAGRYCWRADYSGDAAVGVPSSSDSRVGECFKVNPVTPTLTTHAGTSPVALGTAVTDTADLTGTAYEPGIGGAGGGDPSIDPTSRTTKAQGTITFTLYKANCTDLATGTGTNPQTVGVDGDKSSPGYGPVSFTPDAPGTYHWVASYSGDSPNTNGVTDNAACDQAREDVVVQKVPTSINTAQWVYPNDKATVSTSDVTTGNVQGSVKFRLYDTLPNCQAATPSDTVGTGGLLYKETVNLTGTNTSEDVFTTNTSVKVDTDTTVYWLVNFTSTNPKQFGRNSICMESTQTIFVNDSSGGTAP